MTQAVSPRTVMKNQPESDTFLLDSLIFRSPKSPNEYLEVNITEYTDEGYFVAEIDKLWVVTQGDTFDQLIINVREAVTLAYE